MSVVLGCNRSRYDIVKYLIDNGGANVDLKDGAEHTAYMLLLHYMWSFYIKNG